MTFRPVHFLVLMAGCLSYATAAPYGPDGRETRWTQPNGQVVKLRVFGDEYYARTETPAGFTVVHSDADQTYYYARLSADGNSLVSSGIRADQPAPADLAKHLDLPKPVIRKIAAASRAKFDAGRAQRWDDRVKAARGIRNAPGGAASKVRAAPVSGAKRGLTILVQFPNDPAVAGPDPVNFPTTRDKIVRFCNEEGYTEDGNTGSVRDFFFDQSLGDVTYTQTVTPIVTLPNPYNYYNYSDYPVNKVLYRDIGASASELIADAIAELKKQNFDFSSLTLDANNRAIATNIFFAGPDSGTFARGLWPHQFTIAPTINVGSAANPIIIANYQITNIPDAAPVIGTFCHENGHLLLDYPDIYGADGEGVGEHCLMGSGNYLNGGKTPSPINGYFKEISGWGNVTDIAATEFVTANLKSTGNFAYRIVNPAATTEFFMVENRGNGDKWAEFSRDKGILIWQVDETINGNFNNADHYGVALQQADGKEDLENGRNRGDGTDLFDLDDPKFTDTTKPNARWWDGTKSFIDIEVVSPTAATMTVAFGGVPPNTIIVGTPNGGEVAFKDAVYPITWKANLTGNVKIDLYRAGVFQSTIAANEANDESYDWTVPQGLAATTDYTIRISSVTNPVATEDFSDAPFAVTNATFPANNELPEGWFKPGSADSRWNVTNQFKYEGKYSLRSGETPDGGVSAIAYRSNFKQGFVSFYIKVSSEQGFDFVKFYIDGEAQPLTDGTSTKGFSGDVKWTFVQLPVSAGTHRLMWTYEKDDSYEGLKDAAWIDGVSLPPTTQEIAIQQPVGEDLTSGKSSKVFSSVPVGSNSAPRTFTITNRGKATLSGLKIVSSGANPQDFTPKGLGKTSLKPGASTTFSVVFSPKALGARSAEIQVLSNDGDEGTFSIPVEGTGLGLPSIVVTQPGNEVLKNGDSKNFGIAVVNTKGSTKTFTIVNKGNATLDNLAVSLIGDATEDFLLGALSATSLAPDTSTTFSVTFTPKARNVRNAILRIASNDKKAGVFEVVLVGKGSPPLVTVRSPGLVESVLGAASGVSFTAQPATGIEVIDGVKYRSLTVAKSAGGASPGTVEVSSNLLDWFSGRKHTTILIDDATTLKVRDNTPVTPERKRHIRLN